MSTRGHRSDSQLDQLNGPWGEKLIHFQNLLNFIIRKSEQGRVRQKQEVSYFKVASFRRPQGCVTCL